MINTEITNSKKYIENNKSIGLNKNSRNNLNTINSSEYNIRTEIHTINSKLLVINYLFHN